MSDRIDREIEEILTRLGEEPPERGDEPISLDERRRQQRKQTRTPLTSRARAAIGLSLPTPSPAALLFAGAGVMVAGLILSAIWGALIWLAFAGVVLFLAAFIWSFIRPRRASVRPPAATGGHWRGRYVEYEPTPPGVLQRIRRAFRRR